MSSILGLFAQRDARLPDEPTVRRMLSAMRARGEDSIEVHAQDRLVLAVSRAAWELKDGFSGPVLIARDGPVLVAADASIYYRDDLRRALKTRGVRAKANTPPHLVLAAYQAWGAECAQQLEGDFSFIVYDGNAGRVVAARDFSGKRPLFWAEIRGTLVVGSAISAVRAYPGCPDDLNLVSIAQDASVLELSAQSTCVRAIQRLPAGCSLEWPDPPGPSAKPHWQPPEPGAAVSPDRDSAAEELRALVGRATLERMDANGPTALFLTGGYDSQSIYGAARFALRRGPDPRAITPISVCYDARQSTREDRRIRSMLDWWGAAQQCVGVETVSRRTDQFFRAASRDEPSMLPFESINRSLAQEARRLGARLTVDEHGADQLFAFPASLHSHAGSTRGWFARAVTLVRSGHLLQPRALERAPAPWLSAKFTHEAPERMAAPTSQRAELLSSVLFEEGVEQRTPLQDRRIIEFLARQPIHEHRQRGAKKHLLRRAMRGLLPDQVLAPLVFHSARPQHYVVSLTRALLAEWHVAVKHPLLSELGIIDRDAFRRATQASLARPEGSGLELQLFATLFAELWLRAHSGLTVPSGTKRSFRDQKVARRA